MNNEIRPQSGGQELPPEISLGLQSFERALEQIEISDGVGSLNTSADWGQGRATYGGLVAAAIIGAGKSVVDSDRQLRSLMVTFAGPVEPGKSSIRVEVLRSGRTSTQVEVKISQKGTARTIGLLSYSKAQNSTIVAPSHVPPELQPHAELQSIPFIPQLMPEYFRNFEHKWSHGGIPFSGSDLDDYRGWLRFRTSSEESATISPEHISGLIDAWPPPVLQRLPHPSPLSTITLTIEFLPLAENLTTESWWGYRSRTTAYESGILHFNADLYTESGQLAAISRQTVAVFEPAG